MSAGLLLGEIGDRLKLNAASSQIVSRYTNRQLDGLVGMCNISAGNTHTRKNRRHGGG